MSCAFCLSEATSLDLDLDCELETEEYWPYIHPKEWKKGNAPLPLHTLPMCSPCSCKILIIARCHREMLDLKKKLNAVRTRLSKAVKYIQGEMQKSGKNGKGNAVKIESSGKGKTSKKKKRIFQEMEASSSTGKNEDGMNFASANAEVKMEVETDDDHGDGDPTEDVEEEGGKISPKRIRYESSEANGTEDNHPSFLGEAVPALKVEATFSDASKSESEPQSSSSSSSSSSEEEEEPPPNRKPSIKKKKTFTPQKERLCSICNVSFPVVSLHKHMKGHVGDLAVQCPTCHISFPSRLSYNYYYHRSCKRNITKSTKCEVCQENLTFGRACRHFESHETSEKNFTCPMPSCGKTFTWKQSLELHLGVHETKGGVVKQRKFDADRDRARRPCEICGESLPISSQILHDHIVSHVGSYAFQCPQEECRLTFLSRYSKLSIKHLKSGKNKVWCYVQPKICQVCNESFDHLQKLKYHVAKHETPEKNFTCPLETCTKEFTVRQSVEFHLASHAFQKSLQKCTLCKKSTAKWKNSFTPQKMEHHLRDVHGVHRVFRCLNCPFVFQNDEDLVNHAIAHARVGIRCHICSVSGNGEVFKSGSTLRRHYVKEHGIGKEYLCESCDHSSFSYQSLKQHQMLVHSGPGKGRRTFNCDVCEDKPEFPSAHMLKLHRIEVHNAEKFKCRFCAESFLTSCNRSEHEKYVHEGMKRQPFPCPECGVKLSRKCSLKKHLKNVHNISM